MTSIGDAVEQAEEMGKISALLVGSGLESVSSIPPPVSSRNPGGGMGPLALDVYRTYGRDGLLNIGQGYQAGYNSIANRLGIERIGWSAIKNGTVAVLPPETTAVERTVIHKAM